MRNLLRFIVKNHFGIIFIILEIIALIILVQNNDYQKASTMNLIQRIDGQFHNRSFRMKKYFRLQEENERLVNENLRLREKLVNIDYNLLASDSLILDTSEIKHFEVVCPAKVIKNSVNKQYNYIYLNKGRKHGVLPDMGVISPDGVVGIVKSSSDNFSKVISVLNRDFGLGAKLKSSNDFGNMSWEGEGFRHANLYGIPFHVEIFEGDTVVTSGFSDYFPENIMVGYIEKYKLEGANYYNIDIDLATDFKSLVNVYVIKNILKEEIKMLETEE